MNDEKSMIGTDGGAYVAGDVNIAAGDFVGRDRITIGDVSASLLAISTGVQVIYQHIQRSLSEVEIAEQSEALHRRRLANALSDYIARLERQAKGTLGEQSTGNPYKALLEYDIQDTALFYGRSAESLELLEHIQRGKLILLHAGSGAGKTSLLKAGVMPRLLAAGHLPVYLRPYQTPVHAALKGVFLSGMAPDPGLAGASLYVFLRSISGLLPQRCLVVLVDQFEEVFTVQSAEARSSFVGELAPCLDDDLLPVRWVFALRGEWLSQLGSFRPHIRNPFSNEYLLRPLSREQAEEIIIQPAARRGVAYEAGLVSRLVQDLDDNGISPPQLQLVCATLFDALDGKQTITLAMYQSASGYQGILTNHLDRVLQRDIPPGQRQKARLLLEELVGPEKRRALRSRSELAEKCRWEGVASDELDGLLELLVDSHLIRVTEIGGEAERAYELVHEYLLEVIDISPAVRDRKRAEELIRQELQNWQYYGTLLPGDKFRLVAGVRELLRLNAAEQSLLFRSALQLGQDGTDWLAMLSDPAQRLALLDEACQDRQARVRRQAASLLGKQDLPGVGERLVRLAVADTDPAVRRAASLSLADLAGRRAGVIAGLLQEMESNDRERRRNARLAAAELSIKDIPAKHRPVVLATRFGPLAAAWLKWTLASALGVCLGGILDSTLGVALFDSRLTGTLGTFANLAVLGAFAGFGSGLLQWAALRGAERLPGRWIIASLLGWSAGLALDGAAGFSRPGLLFGLCVGVAQWLALRRRIPLAGLWVLAGWAGWALGLAAGEAVGPAGYRILGWLALGMTGGAVTGWLLAWLLHRSARAANRCAARRISQE